MKEKSELINNKTPITPLWIIALFVSLTETVLGVAVVQTTGGIQMALTAFVVIFPLLIAIAFFMILWNKPYVFYPPNEYGKKTDVASYVKAMQQNSKDDPRLYASIQDTIRKTLSSDDVIGKLTSTLSPQLNNAGKEQIAQILDSAADKALNSIREKNFITIDTRPLFGEQYGKIIGIVYKENDPVWTLLSEIWYMNNLNIEPYIYIEPYTYGIKWALRDTDTGELNIYFKHTLPFPLNKDNYARYVDLLQTINLTDGGIKSGMSFEVVLI
jgi:hypothetical protein